MDVPVYGEEKELDIHWTRLCVPVEPRKKEEIICPWVVKEVTLRHRNGKELTESKGNDCIRYSNAYRTITIPSVIHRLLIALYASCIRTERFIIHKRLNRTLMNHSRRDHRRVVIVPI